MNMSAKPNVIENVSMGINKLGKPKPSHGDKGHMPNTR